MIAYPKEKVNRGTEVFLFIHMHKVQFQHRDKCKMDGFFLQTDWHYFAISQISRKIVVKKS